MNIQIWGTKKCSETRRAERFFRERSVKFQYIDLVTKGPSAGELRSIARAVGGVEQLIDRDGKRYLEKGLKHAAPTGPRIEQHLLDDPLLLRTPLVRNGAEATVGAAEETWKAWVSRARSSGSP